MKCRLCGGSCESYHINTKRWNKLYYICERCNFISIDENELLNSSKELERYEMHNNSIEDSSYRGYFQKFIDYISYSLDKDSRCLDYGSGPEPVLASVMKENGYDIDIYDKYFSPEKVYLDREYDMIISTEVFEHIYDPIEVLREIDNSLKKDGRLVLMTQFHPNNWEKFEKWGYIKDSTHVVFYDMATMEWIANEFNYLVEKHNNKDIVVFKKL